MFWKQQIDQLSWISQRLHVNIRTCLRTDLAELKLTTIYGVIIKVKYIKRIKELNKT